VPSKEIAEAILDILTSPSGVDIYGLWRPCTSGVDIVMPFMEYKAKF
jgi:hypothetical protein